MAAVAIRGTTYPVVLPKLRDPRLHLAVTITSLQVLGQVAFHFRLSIVQILLCLGTVAALEIAITAWKQHVLMWPASALLTGNGVAFVLRVTGTRHGDWWTTRGWWIFVATAAGSLLSKYVIAWRGEHFFNPSNIGLVVVFLVLGRSRVEPLDFWWGPMSWWMVLALAIIVTGGFAILSRLKLLRVALSFWGAFAIGVGFLALGGHAMTARWHLGPIEGFSFWWILVTSPEVLVFLFFMITDPKTAPRDPRARLFYGLTLGFLAAAMIAPTTSEFAAKVALLAALAVVCAVKALPIRFDQRVVVYVSSAGAVAFTATVAFANSGIGHVGPIPLAKGHLPAIEIDASPGVDGGLDLKTARQIAVGVVRAHPAHFGDVLHVHLVPGEGQSGPSAIAQLAGVTYRLTQGSTGWELPQKTARSRPVSVLAGFKLANVAPAAGIDFREGAFRYGIANDNPAMMAGGLCWLDYNGDGLLDLFVVNTYADDNLPAWDEHGGLPRTALYENLGGGRFKDVSGAAHADLQVKGEGCVAGDLDGDGRTDVYVTTATDDVLLWNNGDGTFTEGARKAGIVSFGWHSSATIADVDGDGRNDLFVAGYADMQHPIPSSIKGFPRNYPGVRDELFLNLGGRRFRDVGPKAGLDPAPYDHSLGAEFTDVNGDGRPDLLVANDEDPNRLYMNEPGGPLGFHFVELAHELGVADPNAGMGIADRAGLLFVSNSRGQTHAVYKQSGTSFTDVRARYASAFGTNLTGWGDAWVDLKNSGSAQLVLANGSIPVRSLTRNAAPIQVLTKKNGSWVDTGLLQTLRVNGRGLAAADYDNDGRVDFAVNTVGGKLLLFHNASPAGNWIEVRTLPERTGTVVTVIDSRGRSQVAQVQDGSSYLSSEDPRLHFGLGSATVRKLIVHYPDGTTKFVANVPTNAIVSVRS